MSTSADRTVIPDDDLVERARDGDDAAYVTLYERHGPRAKRMARTTVDQPADVDDVVAEAFAGVLAALRRGKGPTEGFGGYLASAVRHEAYRSNRRRSRQRAVAEASTEDVTDPYGRRDEAAVLRAAMATLPPAARDVLWRTEIDGESHADIAASLGTTTQAVATRAVRARQALGGAYLAAHLGLIFPDPPAGRACRECREHLVDLVRGELRPRRARAVEAHLATCASCRDGQRRLVQLNERLRVAPPLLPLVGTGASLTQVGVETASLFARLGASFGPLLATGAAATLAVAAPIVSPTAAVDEVRTTPAVLEVVTPADAVDLRPMSATLPEPDPGPLVTQPPVPTPGTTPSPVTEPPVTAPPPVTEPPPVTGPPPVTEPSPAPAPPLPPVPPATSPPLITVPPITVPEITLPPITVPPITLPEITVPPIGPHRDATDHPAAGRHPADHAAPAAAAATDRDPTDHRSTAPPCRRCRRSAGERRISRRPASCPGSCRLLNNCLSGGTGRDGRDRSGSLDDPLHVPLPRSSRCV